MSRPLDRFFYPQARSAKTKTKSGATPTRRWRLGSPVGRLRIMLIVVAMLFSLAMGRAVQVQAIDASAVAAEAAQQITVAKDLPALRGSITDRNGEVLAFTEATVTVVADPDMILTNGKFDEEMTDADREVAATAPARIADILVSHIGGSAEDYLERLTRAGSRYAILAREVSAATFARIKEEMSEGDLIGLSSESAPTRRYVNGTLAANIVGFVDQEGVGKAGIEQALNSKLQGTAGKEIYETSPNGKIPLGTSVLVPATNGTDVRLTIDAGFQWQVEQVLAEGVRVSKAASGVAVVMNVKTGEILALANYPSFDPNDYGKSDLEDLGNRAITDAYTPGSVQKVLTFAALLDQGLVKSTDVIELPKTIKSGDSNIKDAFTHRSDPEVMYARGVIARSSNIGAIKLARTMDSNLLRDYMLNFGLGAKTGIGLPGEATGSLPGKDMPGYSRDGLAFGGSAVIVTAVQEAAAIAAVTNGGIYNAPRIIAGTTGADGVETPTESEPRRVISEKASKELRSMMESMVQWNTENGSSLVSIDGYRTGAKTGTSKKYDPDCGCFNGLVTSTIGVGPVEDPQILTYVVIDNPQRGGSGMGVAGPRYHDIMTLALNRYGVKPSTGKVPSLPVYP